jgi:glutathione S-transferase
MTPVLYAHPFSSYSQKALMAFYEKDAPFEYRHMEEPGAMDALKAHWPIGKFPVAETDDGVLIEASIIVEWVDARNPGPRLVPQDLRAALEVRTLDRVFDNYVMTNMQAYVNNRLRPEGTADAYGQEQAGKSLDTIYAWLDQRLEGRTWAAGEDFSMADCAAAPSLFYADWVRPYEEHRNLYAYFQRLLKRPSFARCVEEARKYRHYFPGGAPERPW